MLNDALTWDGRHLEYEEEVNEVGIGLDRENDLNTSSASMESWRSCAAT